MNDEQGTSYVKDLNKTKIKNKCTYEYEKNDTINFLDIMPSKNDDNTVSVRWCKKHTALHRVSNYNQIMNNSFK